MNRERSETVVSANFSRAFFVSFVGSLLLLGGVIFYAQSQAAESREASPVGTRLSYESRTTYTSSPSRNSGDSQSRQSDARPTTTLRTKNPFAPANAVGIRCSDKFIETLWSQSPCKEHGGFDDWIYPTPTTEPLVVIRTIPPPPSFQIITIAPPPQISVGIRIGAICRDGWRSSATGRGACSHHGGVSYWLYG